MARGNCKKTKTDDKKNGASIPSVIKIKNNFTE
jgi:hypothetical protein